MKEKKRCMVWLAAFLALLLGCWTGATYAGCVESLSVDGFESYTDEEGSEIFLTWADGWDDAANGSLVGNPTAPFAEQTIVFAGAQSLSMQYGVGADLSWTERTFDSPQDFTAEDMMALTLQYQGRPGMVGGIAYDEASQTYTMTGAGADIAGLSDELHFASKPLSGNGSITVRVDSMTNTHSWAKAGVMIRNALDPNNMHAAVVVAPSGRVSFVFRDLNRGNTHIHSDNTGDDAVSGPIWVRLTRTDIMFKAEFSLDGTNWSLVEGADPTVDFPEFPIGMGNNTFIGLAVSSHDTEVACEAVFSNVSTTGNVQAGPFTESQDIGIITNAPAPLYVGLEDSAGNVGLVNHPAGTDAVLAGAWTAWPLALADFIAEGVDVTSVAKMQIGVGDRDNPQPVGTGKIYVDSIELIPRMPIPGTIPLFAEDFEGLPLGPNQDESSAGDAVWTDSAPAGWGLDDSGVDKAGDPDNGVDEWEGWSFADHEWWATVDTQRREEFSRSCGTAAIADSDEYDDKGDTGPYNTFMSTPAIDVLAVEASAGAIILRFDSSWRPESSQTANITAQFDDGTPVEVMLWESSSSSPNFHDHMTNELVTVAIDRPAGAKNMVLTFGYFDASNNWWWAIDNVEVLGVPRARTVALAEDFEGLPLGPNVEESTVGDEVWTETPPDGWTVDESSVPGAGDPAIDGVTEWAGWAFADKDWWIEAAGDQDRSMFVLGEGTVAVADPDEWDDASHGDGYVVAETPYATFLETPAIDISTMEAGTVQVKFASSWRDEFDDDYHQSANIKVSYDGGEPLEVLLWESDPTSGNFKNDAQNETVVLTLDNPMGARSMVLTFGLFDAGNDWWWAIDNLEVSGLAREPIVAFSEDFEGLPLGPSVEEDDADPCDLAWTATPPTDWTVDNSGVPEGGTVEWAGWSFTDRNWWSQIGQGRQQFDLGTGIVAVADGDEWDDFLELPDGPQFNTLLSTPEISIAGLEAGSVELTFDSSWRDEDSQTAVITAQFDGADAVEILRWESPQGSAFFKNDAENETVTIPVNNPAGAETVVLTFATLDAGNDWWWAIDNIVVSGLPMQNTVRVFFANFEGLPLEPALDEAAPGGPEVWSPELPAGWTEDDSAMPGIGDPNNDGVTEWAGWNIANKDWWVFVAGDQGRSEFALGSGAVAIADPDEWDDNAHEAGSFTAFMSTPGIDVSSAGGTIQLTFDSSWRPEVIQTGNVTAQFDGRDPVEVMRWESPTDSPFYHDHLTNETVIVNIDKPAGAQNMVLTYGMFDAGNNWFWAIDNINVASNGSSLFSEDFESVALGSPVDEILPPVGNFWTHTPPAGWVNDDSGVPGAGDLDNDGVTEWAGWSFADKDWWIEVAEDQDRSQFSLGQGLVAIVDPDEWDDKDHADGLMNAWLDTPAINIADIQAGTLRLRFDSSWRREDTQTAQITVQYDGADPVEVLRWESEGADTGFLKDDATNETVTIDLSNPEGAAELIITFGMLDGGNDWWWAIDNLEVIGELQ